MDILIKNLLIQAFIAHELWIRFFPNPWQKKKIMIIIIIIIIIII